MNTKDLLAATRSRQVPFLLVGLGLAREPIWYR
jgi:hypothetical protein